MSFRKRYNKALDSSVGDPGKDKYKTSLSNRLQENYDGRYIVEDNSKGNLGLPDLIVKEVSTNEIIHYYEPEVRTNWKDGTQPFPFSIVHVPERKLKYINKVGKDKLTFIVISKDHKGYLKVPASKLIGIMSKTNKYSGDEEEKFLEFNRSDCKMYKF